MLFFAYQQICSLFEVSVCSTLKECQILSILFHLGICNEYLATWCYDAPCILTEDEIHIDLSDMLVLSRDAQNIKYVDQVVEYYLFCFWLTVVQNRILAILVEVVGNLDLWLVFQLLFKHNFRYFDSRHFRICNGCLTQIDAMQRGLHIIKHFWSEVAIKQNIFCWVVIFR